MMKETGDHGGAKGSSSDEASQNNGRITDALGEQILGR
jgi:hypothetical protein